MRERLDEAEADARKAFKSLVHRHGMNIASVVMLNFVVAGLQQTMGNAEAVASLRRIADMVEKGDHITTH